MHAGVLLARVLELAATSRDDLERWGLDDSSGGERLEERKVYGVLSPPFFCGDFHWHVKVKLTCRACPFSRRGAYCVFCQRVLKSG